MAPCHTSYWPPTRLPKQWLLFSSSGCLLIQEPRQLLNFCCIWMLFRCWESLVKVTLLGPAQKKFAQWGPSMCSPRWKNLTPCSLYLGAHPPQVPFRIVEPLTMMGCGSIIWVVAGHRIQPCGQPSLQRHERFQVFSFFTPPKQFHHGWRPRSWKEPRGFLALALMGAFH